jgi:hypothetical protein
MQRTSTVHAGRARSGAALDREIDHTCGTRSAPARPTDPLLLHVHTTLVLSLGCEKDCRLRSILAHGRETDLSRVIREGSEVSVPARRPLCFLGAFILIFSLNGRASQTCRMHKTIPRSRSSCRCATPRRSWRRRSRRWWCKRTREPWSSACTTKAARSVFLNSRGAAAARGDAQPYGGRSFERSLACCAGVAHYVRTCTRRLYRNGAGA